MKTQESTGESHGGNRVYRDDDSKRVVATDTRSFQRTPAENRTTARGRSPGSRVIARWVRLPEALASVAFRTSARRWQLRGQPRIL